MRAGLRRSRGARNLYVWGEAGRGKTWLLDAFFESIPFSDKRRVHFHRLLDDLHQSIHSRRGERDAIRTAVADIAGGVRLLYFDEFHAHDSGDARLLTRILEHVIESGVTIVVSSNYPPAGLLPNPIWHHTIEPAIELISKNMEILELSGDRDLRLDGKATKPGFAYGTWRAVTTPPGREPTCSHLEVRGRTFAVESASDDHLVLTFEQGCERPVSAIEYVHWAREFPRWSIRAVPPFSAADAAAQQRFINLVDVLVDADIETHFTSTLELDEFIATSDGRPDAFRMMSRLKLLRR